jgi:hypothetical protein
LLSDSEMNTLIFGFESGTLGCRSFPAASQKVFTICESLLLNYDIYDG